MKKHYMMVSMRIDDGRDIKMRVPAEVAPRLWTSNATANLGQFAEPYGAIEAKATYKGNFVAHWVKPTKKNPRRRSGLFQARMRDEPLSENERALAKRLRKMNADQLMKMLPAWARPATMPRQRKFIPGQPPVYPAATSGTKFIPHEFRYPEPIEGESTKEYQRRFLRLNHLTENPRRLTKRTQRAAVARRRGRKGIFQQFPRGVRMSKTTLRRHSLPLIKQRGAKVSNTLRFKNNPPATQRERIRHVAVQVRRGEGWHTFAMFPHTVEGKANARYYAKMAHRKYPQHTIRVFA